MCSYAQLRREQLGKGDSFHSKQMRLREVKSRKGGVRYGADDDWVSLERSQVLESWEVLKQNLQRADEPLLANARLQSVMSTLAHLST